MLKKVALFVISSIFLIISIICLVMQFQPIIKNQKYKSIENNKTDKTTIIFFDYNQAKKIVEDRDSILYYDIYYFHSNNTLVFGIENGESYHISQSETRKVDYYLIEKDLKSDNFRNGLFTIKVDNHTYFKPVRFLLLSLTFVIMFIITFIFALLNCLIKKQKLNELEKGD